MQSISQDAKLHARLAYIGKLDGTSETLVLLGVVVLDTNLKLDRLDETALLSFGIFNDLPDGGTELLRRDLRHDGKNTGVHRLAFWWKKGRCWNNEVSFYACTVVFSLRVCFSSSRRGFPLSSHLLDSKRQNNKMNINLVHDKPSRSPKPSEWKAWYISMDQLFLRHQEYTITVV